MELGGARGQNSGVNKQLIARQQDQLHFEHYFCAMLRRLALNAARSAVIGSSIASYSESCRSSNLRFCNFLLRLILVVRRELRLDVPRESFDELIKETTCETRSDCRVMLIFLEPLATF